MREARQRQESQYELAQVLMHSLVENGLIFGGLTSVSDADVLNALASVGLKLTWDLDGDTGTTYLETLQNPMPWMEKYR